MKQNIIRVIRKKRKLWTKYKERKEYRDYLIYKSAESKVKKEVYKAKRDFEVKLAKDIKKNPKAFYSYVRSKSKTKDTIPWGERFR